MMAGQPMRAASMWLTPSMTVMNTGTVVPS